MLFPTSTRVRQGHRRTELAQATSYTTPSADPNLTSLGQSRHQSNRRNSIQSQHSRSPFQNPHIRYSLQGPSSGESFMSPRSNLNGSHNFYASSAPSSTPALLNQSPSQNRPPVPLFTSNSTEHMRSRSSNNSAMEGISALQTFGPTSDNLTYCHIDMAVGNYDFSLNESPVDTFLDYSVFDGKEGFDFEISRFQSMNGPTSAQTSITPLTVSPQDVLLDTMSAPPSSLITNLSTPGTYSAHSPFTLNSADPSPLFEQEHLGEESNAWSSLFAVEGDVNNGGTLPHDSVEYETVDVAAPPPMSRNQSSPSQSSRGSLQGRHSSVSGVNARKRNNPLPPITVDDPSDSVAVKRARNTAAARKSRAKKMEKFDEMAETIERLTAERDHWKKVALSQNDL